MYSKAGTTSFSWNAFKWSTQTPDEVEKRTITCTISLTKDEPTARTTRCQAFSEAKGESEGESKAEGEGEEESGSELKSCPEGTFLYNNICSGNEYHFKLKILCFDIFSIQVARW